MSVSDRVRAGTVLFLAAAVWAIGAADLWARSTALDERGRLEAFDKAGKSLGNCPLKHTEVNVDVSGFIARATVRQKFTNKFADKIEAIYVFPLSENAAVDRMTMTIGNRVIEGQIKERKEAREIYEKAKKAGHVASLLDQERPNIFTQSVANIEPGVEIDITISYSETLEWKDGLFQFVFPMVVGPRYVPGQATGPGGQGFAPPTDQVPDADRITPKPTPEGTRAGHDIAITVNLDAGLPIRSLESKQHAVDVQYLTPDKRRAAVKLQDLKTIPNKDFVLEYQTSSDQIEDAILTHTDERGKFFTLILQPPKRVRQEQVVPKELIFTIDKSGSMSGFPIETAKTAMRQCIEGLYPNDTFNLMTFEGGVGFCFPKPVPNTEENRRKALNYLNGLQGSGGTEMMQAIHACLAGQDDPQRVRIVCFMTDGYVGNDMAIIDAVKKNAGQARVFSFGIGTSVNRFLLDRMARAGRGEVHYVLNQEQAKGAGERFHERVRMPVLTDVRLDFGTLEVKDVYPPQIPDLFAVKPVVVKGRYLKAGKGTITLLGHTSAGPFERKIDVMLPESNADNAVLAPLWARAKVDHLMDQDLTGIQQEQPNPAVKEEIVGLGLRYQLLTQFTSFVAVEKTQVTKDGRLQTVTVPVEMPEGVSREGVFGSTGGQGYGGLFPSGARAARYRGAAPQGMGGMGMGGMGGGMGGGAGALPGIMGKPSAAPGRAPAAGPAAADRPTRNKLAPELRDLPQKLAALGAGGNLRVGKLTIQNGLVKIRVQLSALSDEIVAKLKKAGFQETGRDATRNELVGSIAVVELTALAAIDEVTHVDPAP